jgi:hypothetical protein
MNFSPLSFPDLHIPVQGYPASQPAERTYRTHDHYSDDTANLS